MPFFRSTRGDNSPTHEDLLAACRHNPPNEGRLKSLLAKNPSLVNGTDVEGNNALHIVCMRSKTSLDVIKILVSANPDVCRQPNLYDGSLPLHLAILFHLSPEVIHYLLDKNPRAVQRPDKLGNLPLHLACTAKAPFEVVIPILQTWPMAAQRLNLEGKCPLHCACTATPLQEEESSGDFAYEVIWGLLEAWPDAVIQRDRKGDTPYDILLRGSPHEDLLRLLRETPTALMQFSDDEDRRHRHDDEIQETLLEKKKVRFILDENYEAKRSSGDDKVKKRIPRRRSRTRVTTEKLLLEI